MSTTSDTSFDYFYYYNDNIFGVVSHRSLTATQHIKNEEGTYQTGKLAMTDTERQLFQKNLRRAANDVYRAISRFGHNITGAFKYGIDLSTIGLTNKIPAGIGFIFFLDLPDNFDENLRSVLDINIEDAIIYYVLMEWYDEKGLFDQFAVAKEKYDRAMRDIKSDLVAQVYNDRTVRPHRTF